MTAMKDPTVSIPARKPLASASLGGQYLIEVKLRDVHQLFNSMDPSPFNEKDLDHDAEEFIVSWALEHPSHASLKLVVHLAQLPQGDAQAMVENAIHHYFTYKAEMNWREFKVLMKEGRLS